MTYVNRPSQPPEPSPVPTPSSARHGRRARVSRGARVCCLVLLVVPALWAYGPYIREDRVRDAARPYEFQLGGWEAQALGGRLPVLVAQMVQPPTASPVVTGPGDVDHVRAFFAAAERWWQVRADERPPAEREAMRAEWVDTWGPAEAAIARGLAALATEEGLLAVTPVGEWLLPPVSFVWSEPPRVLVVSPRDRIEVAQSVLLRPEVRLAEAEALERDVERLGASALVVEIGGIATYPAMVPLQTTPVETLAAVAHEWLHGYLFFQPLGRAYFGSYDARSLNETVAELGGRELGAALARAYGLPTAPPEQGGRDSQDGGGFDFRREMQATRLGLDARLAAGEISEAERYLEARRERFVAAGYRIRKLNQAYFAFHGSYGDSPATVSPLDGQVRALRARSKDLGDFLRAAAQLTSSADLAAALGNGEDAR